MTSQEDKYFNMKKLHNCLKLCLIENYDINIREYLEVYKELQKFCMLLGSVFSFVSNEIKEKSDVMLKFQIESIENFSSLKKMIEYEKESNLLYDTQYTSGCRTLLRLHRGLDFIRTFLKRLSDLELDQGTGSAGSASYYDTLAQFHSWLIRQGAYIAMALLPTKRNLLRKVCGSDQQILEAQEMLPGVLEAMDEVYSITQNYYKKYDLLDLP